MAKKGFHKNLIWLQGWGYIAFAHIQSIQEEWITLLKEDDEDDNKKETAIQHCVITMANGEKHHGIANFVVKNIWDDLKAFDNYNEKDWEEGFDEAEHWEYELGEYDFNKDYDNYTEEMAKEIGMKLLAEGRMF